MRSKPLMAAVLGMGLAITSCSTPVSNDVETLASTAPDAGLQPDASSQVAAPAPTEPTSAGALVVDVDPAAGQASGSTTADDSTTITPTSTASTVASSATAPSETTTASTTATTGTTVATTATTRQTTTTATPTTQRQTTTAPPPTTSSGSEARPELLRLALPTFGGGTFNPDSMVGKNVVLWFWGAH